MKKEIPLNNDKRYKLTGSRAAKSLIKFYKNLGYSADEIKVIFEKLKAEQEAKKIDTTP